MSSNPVKNGLTENGIGIIQQYLLQPSSNTIIFTGAKIGTGDFYSETRTIEGMTALISPVSSAINADVTLAGRRLSEDHLTLTISVQFTNLHVTESIAIKEIGIYAKLNQSGSEVLFSYLTMGDFPDTILPGPNSSQTATLIERFYDIPFKLVGDVSEGVTLTVSSAATVRSSDTAYVPTPNKLLYLDTNGKLPGDITGDADTVDGKHSTDFATANHRHDNATSSADGFLSSTDKASLDTLVTRVNQGVKSSDTPTFVGINLNGGVINGAVFG